MRKMHELEEIKNGILKISVPKIKEEEKFIDLKIK